MHSALLQRNFAMSLQVDQCKMTLTVAIEKLRFEISLLDYDWGKHKEIGLKLFFQMLSRMNTRTTQMQ
jgi:hypothetical protein